MNPHRLREPWRTLAAYLWLVTKRNGLLKDLRRKLYREHVLAEYAQSWKSNLAWARFSGHTERSCRTPEQMQQMDLMKACCAQMREMFDTFAWANGNWRDWRRSSKRRHTHKEWFTMRKSPLSKLLEGDE